MRIAILSCFHPYRGGIAQFNASLLKELGEGHVVKAFNFKRQYPDFLFPGRTQYVTPEDKSVPIESEALLDTINPFSWARTAREIAKWEPDLLIVRYWMPWFAPSLGYVVRRLRKHCVTIAVLDNVVPHERHFFDALLSRYFLGGIRGNVVMCKEVGSDLLKLKPDAKYMVHSHPVYSHFGTKITKEEAEKSLGLKPGYKNLLFFGLIRQYKGLDILLKTLGTLPDDFRLIVAGEPYESFDEYRKIIETSPAKERIFLYTEYIKDSDVKLYFSAADAVVLPYRSATQSGVNAIALHFGVPMVVTDVGGLRETIGEKGTGIVAAAANPKSIRDAVLQLFENEEKALEIERSIEKERDSLSWSGFCRDLLDFSKKL